MTKPTGTAGKKKNQLTLAQLAAYDDILTDALVDHVSIASFMVVLAAVRRRIDH